MTLLAGSMRPEDVPVDAKKALVALSSEVGCTLDGEPASVSGFLNDFASVMRRDGRGGTVTFSWPTVDRILHSHRAFQS